MGKKRRLTIDESLKKAAQLARDWIGDDDLKVMTYADAMFWAAGEDGRLVKSHLERIARVRNYKSGWVYFNEGRLLRDVLAELEEGKRQKSLREFFRDG